MVGTMIVLPQAYVSHADITASGSKTGTTTRLPPVSGPPRIAPIEAAWNIGTCAR
jgi:hypothetical protein